MAGDEMTGSTLSGHEHPVAIEEHGSLARVVAVLYEHGLPRDRAGSRRRALGLGLTDEKACAVVTAGELV